MAGLPTTVSLKYIWLEMYVGNSVTKEIFNELSSENNPGEIDNASYETLQRLFSDQFANIAFNLEVGSIALQPIATRHGIYLIKRIQCRQINHNEGDNFDRYLDSVNREIIETGLVQPFGGKSKMFKDTAHRFRKGLNASIGLLKQLQNLSDGQLMEMMVQGRIEIKVKIKDWNVKE